MINWKRLIVMRMIKKRGKKVSEDEPCLDDERREAIQKSRVKRQQAETKINNMVAQINGCGDRWFLQPLQTIDECVENGENK